MKKTKLFSTFCLFMSSLSLFASNNENEEFKQNFNEVTICCLGHASEGVYGSAGYIKISVKKCATSAKGNKDQAYVYACTNAQKAAENALNALKNMDLTLKQS